MPQVPSFDEFEKLRKQVQDLQAEVAQLKAALPEWVREEEAQRITGLSQATLARARKKPDTLLVVTTTGPLRYLRSSLIIYTEERSNRRSRHLHARSYQVSV
jgi:hypothetical protein